MRLSSSGVGGLSRAIAERLRRADPTARVIPEIRVVTEAAIKQTPADWEAADDPAGFAITDDGVVRLTDGTDVLVSHGAGSGTDTTLSELRLGGDGVNPYPMIHVTWGGPEGDMELLRVTVRLHPRLSGAQSKTVAFWRLRGWAVVRVDQNPTEFDLPFLQLAPLFDYVDKTAVGEAEGDVLFDLTAIRPRPKGVIPLVGSSTGQQVIYSTFPQTVFRVTAHQADGSPADNVALIYDAGTASVTSGGNILTTKSIQALGNPGWTADDQGLYNGTPRASFETGAYTSDDLDLTHPGNWLDLNATRENLCGSPDELDDTAHWSYFQAIIDDQATAAPNGLTEADKIIESSAAGAHTALNPPGSGPGHLFDTGERIRVTACCKASGRNIRLGFTSDAGFSVDIDLSNGDILAAQAGTGCALLSYKVVAISTGGGSWYYIEIEGTLSQRFGYVALRLLSGSSDSYTGDGTSGVFVWRVTVHGSPAAVPDDLTLSLRGGVPTGTQLVGRIRNDADTDWVTFVDGQTFSALGLTATVVRKARVQLITDGGGALTPSLTYLAMEDDEIVDLSHVAEVESLSEGLDPIECKGEIGEVRIRSVKDGDHDFRSVTEDLLSRFFLRDMTLRLWVGADDVPRDQWLHRGDYLVTDYDPRAADCTLIALSPLVFVRTLLPPYSPGEALVPDDEAPTGEPVSTWTDDGGGSTNMEERVQTEDQMTFIQSPAAPSADEIAFSVSNPRLDITGRRIILEYEFRKDAAAGMTINLTSKIKDGLSEVLGSNVDANIGADWQRGSWELTPAEIAALGDADTLRIEFEANNSGGTPNRRAQVSWCQLRTGGRRGQVVYLNATRQAVFEDLVRNQLEVPARYWGPGVVDAVRVVSKELSPAASRLFEKENLTSKTDVDAICFLGGEALIESQGRLKVVKLFDTKPLRATFHEDEIEVLSTSPGLESAIPEYFVKYRYNAGRGGFEAEVRGLSGAGDNLPLGRIDGPREVDEEVAKWIHDEALATEVAERMVTNFASGYLAWEFRCIIAHPELEPGDLISLPVRQFVGRDPISGHAFVGVLYARAVIRKCYDAMGYRFGVWVRSYSDLVGTSQSEGGADIPPPVVSREVVMGAAQYVRAGVSTTWDLKEGYSQAVAFAPTNYLFRASLNPTELPNGAHLVDTRGRAYIGTVGGASGDTVVAVRLFAAPVDGSAAFSLGSHQFGTSQSEPLDEWVVASADSPATNTTHIIDWDIYSYFSEVVLQSANNLANTRFRQHEIVWS